MINLRKTLQDTHYILENQGIAHALIGGFALAAYGNLVKKYADLFQEWTEIQKLKGP